MDKRYIEKSAFLAEYEKAKQSNKTYTIKGVLDATPTVDAVEVVRCKNCKHSYFVRYTHGACDYWCRLHKTVTGNPSSVKSYDFCSYGEKSESEAKK